jgi:hypothetical protein
MLIEIELWGFPRVKYKVGIGYLDNLKTKVKPMPQCI